MVMLIGVASAAADGSVDVASGVGAAGESVPVRGAGVDPVQAFYLLGRLWSVNSCLSAGAVCSAEFSSAVHPPSIRGRDEPAARAGTTGIRSAVLRC
jgi:hypothetical protein